MKMYQYLIALLLAGILTANRAGAQSTTPYLLFKTTWAFPANPQKINEAVVVAGGREYTRGVYGSYGRGLALQLGIGKMINATFGFELSGEFLLGRKITSTASYNDDSIAASGTDRARGLIFKPVIVIRNSGDLLSIYTKAGLAIATATNIYTTGDLRLTAAGNPEQVLFEAKEISRAKIGFTVCFGLAFRVSESVSLLVEANGQMLSLPITRGHYTRFTENGVDKLPEMKTNEKSWVYKREGFFDDSAGPNQPEERLYEPANFSYIGAGIGLVYHF